MAFIDSTVVNVALPAIQRALGGTVIDMQWVVEGYALFLSALILAGGAMGDVFGRRRMFLAGVTLFAIASAGCGLAANIQELEIARAVQGFGAAFLVPGSLSIISASFGEKQRGRAIGTWSGFTSIATAGGPVLGGWLIEHASWRWVFFINMPLAATVIALSFLRVPESKNDNASSIDWIGALIVTIGLAGVTYGFIESANRGWKSPSVLGTSIAGCAFVAIFPYFEAHARSPMVPLKLFRSRDFTGANLITLFLYAPLGIFFFLYPLDLIQIQRYSATATGAAALPFILLMFLLSRWSGGLVGRFGAKRPLMLGPLIAAVGFILFIIPSVGGSYWINFFPGFFVLGLGMAVSVAPLTTVVMGAVEQKHAGTASGINNAVARIAGLLAIATLGMTMVSAFSHYLNERLTQLNLSAEAIQSVQSEEIRLAALPVPPGVDGKAATALEILINRAFVFGFRLVMLICAGLSLASSAFAYRMIGTGVEHPSLVRI